VVFFLHLKFILNFLASTTQMYAFMETLSKDSNRKSSDV